MCDAADKESIRHILEPYLEEVLDEQDQVLFAEAVQSAGAGALRAAYLMTWLSCAESLKRRFKEMAPRDGSAKKIAGKVTRKEDAQQSVDSYLLDRAKEYGFIGETDHSRLMHVYNMRCIYGHPYEEQPSKEDLISAASTVLEVVLGRPLKLRHGYLDDQVRLLTKEKNFLDDVPEAVERYVEEVLPKVDEALHVWFLQKLWREAEKLARDPSMGVFLRRAVWFSIGYLKAKNDLMAEWDFVPDLTNCAVVASQILAEPTLFSRIGEHAQDVVVAHLVDFARTTSDFLYLLENLDRADALTSRQKERFTAALNGMQMAHIAESGIHPKCSGS